MLDQNTDRMWYVIGAVLIGAAIIFGMNTLMPNAFASVSESFEVLMDSTTTQTLPRINMSENVFHTENLTYHQWLTPSSGELYQSNDNDIVSDFLEIDAGVEYIFKTPRKTSMSVHYYDVDKNHIDGIYKGGGSVDRIRSVAPDNAVFARITGRYRRKYSSPLDTWWFGSYDQYLLNQKKEVD